MINYPNGKKYNNNHNNTSASNRGMALEDDINAKNKYYFLCAILFKTVLITNFGLILLSRKYEKYFFSSFSLLS